MTEKKRLEIETRYRENKASLPNFDCYIFSQRSGKFARLRYGEYGHIDQEGCGVVALYNALKYSGRMQDICELLRDMERLNMPWLGAKLGTKPHSLSRYFQYKKIPFRKYNAPVEFKASLLTHDIGIVCTWNRRMHGIHFYCVCYDAGENVYYSVNLHSSDHDFKKIMLDEISNPRFITGYVI